MKKETITLRYGLIRIKIPISKVSEFSILPYTQNWKLRNLRKFSFTSNFDSTWNSNLKTKNNDLEEKTWTLQCGLRRTNAHFQSFQVLNFALLEIKNLVTSKSFCLLQVFIVLVAWSMEKVKEFHWISN